MTHTPPQTRPHARPLLALLLAAAGLLAGSLWAAAPAQAQQESQRTAPSATARAENSPTRVLDGTHARQAVLYEQVANDTVFAISSQDLTPSNADDDSTFHAADDFTVPAGG